MELRITTLALAFLTAAVLADNNTGNARDDVPRTEPLAEQPSPESSPGVEPEIARFEQLTRNRKPVRYKAPTGFGGHSWGQRFAEFDRLNPSPVTLDVAYSQGVRTLVETLCPPVNCSMEQALNTLRQKVEGNGFQLLAEFVVPNQGFRYRETGVLMYPVTYQFCAQWQGATSKAPDDILDRMKLCGVRLVFNSQKADEIAQMAPEALTNYELLLHELIREFGKPASHFRQEQVIIQTPDGLQGEPRERRFKTWRWCPPVGRNFATSCDASIVFGFNPASGNGVVLFSTPAVWYYAYARDLNVPGHDPMYRFMHGHD